MQWIPWLWPNHARRGFTRVRLAPGESKRVQFDLTPRDLSYVNEGGEHLVGGGRYEVSVGGGQPGTGAPGAAATFKIIGR